MKRMKRVLAMTLAAVMSLSLVACGNKDEATGSKNATERVEPVNKNDDNKLVIWTLANDLIDFGERFQEQTGVEVETVVIKPEDYSTKVQAALLDDEEVEPDIIVGEPQMLEDFYDLDFFQNLDMYGAQDYADQIVDYVWKVGQDSEGIQRAISYQITPAGIYFRRDIAEKVFGTSDPAEISKLFADYPTIMKTAKTLKDAGYRIFASDAEINYFSGDSAWVIDNKLNLDSARIDYMDLCVDLYQQDMTAYAAQWATPWYQAMAGEVPILTAETQGGVWDDADGDGQPDLNIWDAENYAANIDKYSQGMTEVFAFGLPAWGVLTMRDNVKETAGKWGVCQGPAYGFGGGTFIGIAKKSERQKTAWDFVKFATLNEDTANWWIEYSQGDTVSLISALNAHKDDENAVYGGQKLYSFWQEQAKGIDYSKVTRYDKLVGDAWGEAISNVKTGKMTKDEAINNFYEVVGATYPELTIEK